MALCRVSIALELAALARESGPRVPRCARSRVRARCRCARSFAGSCTPSPLLRSLARRVMHALSAIALARRVARAFASAALAREVVHALTAAALPDPSRKKQTQTLREA